MVSTPLDMKYVYKRERYLEKKRSLNENVSYVPILSNINNKNLYKQKVESFIKECTSYKDALSLLEVLYNDNRFDLLEYSTQRIINEIIPMVESKEIPECINYIINDINIGDVNKDRLIETAKIYKSIDRIRKNNRNLSKRFGLNSFNGKSDKEKCYSICEMVDTYNLSTFIKFNIVLEELAYIGYVEGNRMDDKVMVEHTTNYFLLREDNTHEDIDSYKRAIKECRIISEGSDVNVDYLMNGVNNSNYWLNKLNEWKIDPNKKIDTIIELAKNNYSNITVLNTILETIKEFVHINNIEFDTMSIFEDFKHGVSGDEAYNIMSIIKENNIKSSDDLVTNLRCIFEAEANDNIYDDGTKKPETFTSDEIDKFKMHNLITDAQAVGEFLDQLEKTSMKEFQMNIKNIFLNKSIRDLNESNIINLVDANGYISMKIRSYSHNGIVEDVQEFLESSVKCINNILYNSESICYYTIGEDSFDISIRSKYKILLTESQEINRGFSNPDKEIICDINRYVNLIESINNSKLNDIIDKMMNDRTYASEVSVKEVVLIYEILNPYIDKEFMESFINICKEEANTKYDKMLVECSYVNEEAFDPLEDHISRINFCAYNVLGLSEANEENLDSANKRDINNFNDVKLAWQGVKAKLKNASAKEQEMSRDLDMEFNHILKNIKMIYGTDHREEIITGEINRSLSKAIKIALGLAGIGVMAKSAMIPILGAIGIFVRSKFTTNKEKKMILDEIDIELKVIEREIARAEQSGSTKKYRQLLTIQKNMQRRRQEIYYGLAKKGKRIPMQATDGLRSRE